MTASWEAATHDQYDDDTNLAARQALFDWLTAATPLPAPLSDLSTLSGQRVLDIGCGNGRFLAQAVHGDAIAFGADFSFGMAQAAHAEADAPTLQSDAHRLPFADASFDTMLALWMIYHLDDRPAALREMRRTLTDDGQLVAATNSEAHGRLDEIVLDALEEQLGRHVPHWHAPLTFTSENGADTLRSAFPHVAVYPFGNTFNVGEADVLVRYVGSMLGPIQAEHGKIDTVALLTAIGRSADAEIAKEGSLVIERGGTVFIAHS